MKAIMISIKSKWVAKILNGEKTIEIRKTMPKCDLPIDVYIYCTKDKQGLWLSNGRYDLLNENKYVKSLINGKVVAKFTLNRIDRHHILPTERILPFNWNVEQKLNELCLTKEEVMAYGNGEDYYACLWHISNLEIFDKPKELCEFSSCVERGKCKDCVIEDKEERKENCPFCRFPLTKAPQSFCYVEVELG